MEKTTEHEEPAEAGFFVDEEEYQKQMEERLQVFGHRLAMLVQRQVGLRSATEQRWLEDLRQYNGKYSPDEYEALKSAGGSRVYVNITRNKTNAAEARLSDMLFPTDDKNWGIRPTPVPTLAMAAKQPHTEEGQNAGAVMAQAKQASELMASEIDDQLKESMYHARSRDMIHDACVLGTGVIKGPVVVGNLREAWTVGQDGVAILQVQEEIRPDTQYVDVWNFYPDMSAATIEEAEFFFERHMMTRKQLIQLARSPGFMREQIRAVLRSDPRESQSSQNWKSDLRGISGADPVSENKLYEMWEYTGAIDAADLESAGFEAPEDELSEAFGTVFFIGPHVIKVSLSPLETSDIPYRVFCWEKDRSSIFGFGVPYLMRQPQRVMNSSWRMILDNGGLSTGPQIVVDREAIEPADGKWSIGPRKVWWKKKQIAQDIDHVFKVYQINNNQGELLNIFQQARQLADEETNLPLIAQGEQTSNITQTAQGMSMLMNSANIVLRRAIKNFDDDVTTPHIRAYYNWNMQFSDKPEIKGDFTVDARGSGALLAREQQQQALMTLAQIAGGNQEFAIRTDWNGLYMQIVKYLQVSKEDVVLPDEEVKQKIEAASQQQGDPMMQLRQQELQLEAQKLQLRQVEIQQDGQLQQAKLQQEGQIEMLKIQLDRDLRTAALQIQQATKVSEIQSRQTAEAAKIQTARDIAAGNQTLEQSKQILQNTNLQQGHDTF